jgi:hypothetical protein
MTTPSARRTARPATMIAATEMLGSSSASEKRSKSRKRTPMPGWLKSLNLAVLESRSV